MVTEAIHILCIHEFVEWNECIEIIRKISFLKYCDFLHHFHLTVICIAVQTILHHRTFGFEEMVYSTASTTTTTTADKECIHNIIISTFQIYYIKNYNTINKGY